MKSNIVKLNRRSFLTVGGVSAAAAAGLIPGKLFAQSEDSIDNKKEENNEEGVSPNEDLMREHGVLRRILLIYRKIMSLLISDRQSALKALAESSSIVRSFIEDYHEKLEENYLFDRFRKKGKLVDLVDTLAAQHNASRKLTDTIIKIANDSIPFSSGEPDRLIRTISDFLFVYYPHAAREDTVLFPAFREITDPEEYESLGEVFEEKEHELFGPEGFTKEVEKVVEIEKSLGIYDLAQFTPRV